MPDVRNVHVDGVLTNLSIAYRPAGMIAEDLLPVVTVNRESDLYDIYGRESFRSYQTRRAPRTRAAEIDWAVSQKPYTCEEYALVGLIEDRERRNADAPLQLDRDTVTMLQDTMLLDQERRVAELLVGEGTVITTADVPATAWSDYDDSDPVGDVLAATSTMVEACGRQPNTMVLPWHIYQHLKLNANVLDRVVYTQRGVITSEILASVFEVERVLIPMARYNTAPEDVDDTQTMDWVWPSSVLLAYIAGPRLKTITLGLIFRAAGWQVRRWREEDKHCDAIEVSVLEDEVVVCSDAGIVIPCVLGEGY